MNLGMRQRPVSPPDRAFLLMSVIALLALACLPAFARAESASGVQYQDDIPTAEGGGASTHRKQENPAKSSSTGAGSGATEATGSKGSRGTAGSGGNEATSHQDGGVSAVNGDGTGQGSPGMNNGDSGKTGLQPNDQVASPASSSGDGGSSPLVPILVAIAALAAISVGTVMLRQRKQRRGPGGPTATASPEAN